MIIEILVTGSQPIDALPQQIDLAMGDQLWIARIRQRRIEGGDQAQPTIRLAQQQDAAIAGDIAPVEIGLDFPAIKAWKGELRCGTVWQ